MTKTILLVDDSRTALMLQRMMLAETGFEIITASDGREGVEIATEIVPDLIVMDVTMPGMSGYDAVRRIRAVDALAGVPIIMVTTRSKPYDISEGYAAGCTAYMTKPFDGHELQAKIMSYLEGSEASEAEPASARVLR